MNPLVSLVSPVYNAMPWLESFLDCMVQQTWRPLEVILVEDGSTDASRECLLRRRGELEDAGITVRLVLKEHAGQAAAFNAALPLVSGEFFTWCDSDDLLTPDSIEKKVLWLLAHPDVGMVRSNGIVLDADKDEVLSESTPSLTQTRTKCFLKALANATATTRISLKTCFWAAPIAMPGATW